MNDAAKAKKIARRNDEFRRGDNEMAFTSGAFALPDLAGLLQAVKDYRDFTTENDPEGEHDFGVIEWKGEVVFWKIDYYDPTLEGWCDPLAEDCRRVLTVLLDSEW